MGEQYGYNTQLGTLLQRGRREEDWVWALGRRRTWYNGYGGRLDFRLQHTGGPGQHFKINARGAVGNNDDGPSHNQSGVDLVGFAVSSVVISICHKEPMTAMYHINTSCHHDIL